MRELVFEVIQEDDGGYCARSVGEHIFTQGDTWEELEAMALDATRGYFAVVGNPPDAIRLHWVREKVLPLVNEKVPQAA